jgi:hypothetical protein
MYIINLFYHEAPPNCLLFFGASVHILDVRCEDLGMSTFFLALNCFHYKLILRASSEL